MAGLLDDDAIARFCATHTRWRRDGNALVGQVEAATFMSGIDLVVEVAKAAEELDHHPDISISWRTVTFTLSTHSAGGITELDTELAQRIEELVRES